MEEHGNGKVIDRGGPIVMPALPGHAVDGYGMYPAVCVAPDCDCTSMAIDIRIGTRDGAYLDFDGPPVARVRVSKDGDLLGTVGDEDDSAPDPWLQELLACEEAKLRLRERWRRARGQCGDPAYPNPELPPVPDGMVAYEEALPYDFDLVVNHDQRVYAAVDCHCLAPGCACDDVVVQFFDLSADSADFVGSARASVRKPARATLEQGSEAAHQLWAALLRTYGSKALRDRRRRVRTRARRQPSAATAGGKSVGRNEPCPCGSGKKYKRCCANNGAA